MDESHWRFSGVSCDLLKDFSKLEIATKASAHANIVKFIQNQKQTWKSVYMGLDYLELSLVFQERAQLSY